MEIVEQIRARYEIEKRLLGQTQAQIMRKSPSVLSSIGYSSDWATDKLARLEAIEIERAEQENKNED